MIVTNTDVRVGIVGLGRLGKTHAVNLINTRNCRLTAACSIIEDELGWAKHSLPGVSLFRSYDELLQSSEVDAVFLVTTTAMHAEQIIKGLRAGKHVFCEKPLGIEIDHCRQAAKEIQQNARDKVFMLGFVRRYDPAYEFAKKKIEEGAIGSPFLVRAQTADHDDFAPFQVAFTQTGGGIFHDMNVHDIDLARWYLGSEISKVYAIGGSYVHKEFADINDADNTSVSCEFENGSMAVISASRTAFHGHDTRTEIHGSKGILRIGYVPSVSDVEILDTGGMRKECVYAFGDRFAEAFKREAQDFIDCVQRTTSPRSNIYDALQATVVAEAFTASFKNKRIVNISEI